MKRPTHSNLCEEPVDVSSILTGAATRYHVYYYRGKLVEIVQRPRTTSRINWVYVRDVESGMCFLAEWHLIVHQPRTK